MEDVSRFLTSAWRGVDAAQERGGTSCPARAELPEEPEDLLPGSRPQDREARPWTVEVTPGPVPVPGVMVSPPGRAGATPVGGKGPEVSPGKGAGRVPR